MDTEKVALIVIFGVFALVMKWWMEYRLKSKLIERGMVDERIKLLNVSAMGGARPSSLKWGIIFTLVGGALLIMQFADIRIDGEVVFAILLLAAGIGLLSFYSIDSIMRKSNPNYNGTMPNQTSNTDSTP
ncbi:MAG: DUF6249 domain-containing protein [Candidatus Zixiibacteriota bacterium]